MQQSLSQWQLNYLRAQLEISKGKTEIALQILQSANPSIEEDKVEQWLTMLSLQNKSGMLSASEKATLLQISQSQSTLANASFDWLHAFTGNHDYRFGCWYINPAGEGVRNLPENTFVNVMPNPTENFANVQFALSGNKTSITLHDLTGNLLTSVELQQGAGAYKLDLRNLSNGVYLVSVTDNDSGEKKVTKLIKQ